MGKLGKTMRDVMRATESPVRRAERPAEYLPTGGKETPSERLRIDLRARAAKLKLLKGLAWQAFVVRIRDEHNTLWQILDTLHTNYKDSN